MISNGICNLKHPDTVFFLLYPYFSFPVIYAFPNGYILWRLDDCGNVVQETKA